MNSSLSPLCLSFQFPLSICTLLTNQASSVEERNVMYQLRPPCNPTMKGFQGGGDLSLERKMKSVMTVSIQGHLYTYAHDSGYVPP